MTGGAGAQRPAGDDGPALRPTGHARVDAGRYDELHAALVAELDAEPGTVPAGLVPRPGTGQEEAAHR